MRRVPESADPADARCQRLIVQVTRPDGGVVECGFSILALQAVAGRAAARLVEAKVLQPGELYLYEVVVNGPAPSSAAPPGFAVSLPAGPAPLQCLTLPLRPLRARAVAVGNPGAEEFPVFYTVSALESARACARRGETVRPPVETGCVLLGSLVACPETGELAAVITQAVEVSDPEERTTFRLTYSGRTWQRIQAVLEAHQRAYPERALRLLEQAHGHPFLPEDGGTCADCARRPTCTLTSVFVSEHDATWHRAVFARQPWAVCHIFGLTARGEPVARLFAMRDGRLQPRGFYCLADFPIPDANPADCSERHA